MYITIYVIISLLLGLVLLLNQIRQNLITAVFYSIFIGLLFFSFLEITGTPKNIMYEWRNIEKNIVVGEYLDEPKAIYVLLLIEGTKEPIVYKLPWNIKTAENLRKVKEEAKKTGSGVNLNIRAIGENNDQIFRKTKHRESPAKSIDR